MTITKTILEDRIKARYPQLMDFLAKIVSIQSVSSDLQLSEQLEYSAEVIRQEFEKHGFEAKICSAFGPDNVKGKPAVLAKKITNPDAPTVLLYAHHDVQPIGNPSRWSKPPFSLTEENGRVYGRGSSDDGGGIIAHLGAVSILGQNLPVNLVVFIEGEEEIGSPSFSDFLTRYQDELRADVIIVADSLNWTESTPALTSSLRGVCACDVTVQVLEHAVHSGMFGGPILDAVTLSARLIASLHDAKGNVAIPGLGGTDQADVVWDEDSFRSDASVIDGYQLAGSGDLAARVWTKPAISIIGMDVCSTEQSANTIAADCTFRVSLRTVPGIDPEASMKALVSFLKDNSPFGAKVTVTPVELGPGFEADLDSEVNTLYRKCLEEAWGNPAVSIGVGGSIPFISEFQKAFPDAQIVVTGIEDPQSNAHSEDESIAASTLRNAALAEALFLVQLGKK